MIDLHSHILPGVDDGVTTPADARLLAEAALRGGVTAIAATPHVREDYPTSADRMERGVAELRRDLADAGIPLTVLHGAEIDLDYLALLGPEERQRFSLGQTGRYLLLEFPGRGWPLSLEMALQGLRRDGMTAVLAHPERNTEVQERPERLESALRAGAIVQVTTASLAGRSGRAAQATARRLIRQGLVDLLASDAHHAESRGLGLDAVRAAVRDPGLVEHLTREVPAAIVAGEAVPARLLRSRRRRLIHF